MKIATWNVASARVRLPHIQRLLIEQDLDILALQEIKCTDSTFPFEAFAEIGYHAAIHGQKSYNGVALLSRTPAIKVDYGMPQYPDEQARVIHAWIKGLHCICVYVPNGNAIDSPRYAYKLEWLNALSVWLGTLPLERTILMGDMNIAPEDRDIYDAKRFAGQVLCSDPERAAFTQWQALALHDSFRLFSSETAYSWWDYRLKGFERNWGWRIDHILISQDLIPLCNSSTIYKEARAWERPSDHAPVIIELQL